MVSKEAIWSPEKYMGMTAKDVVLEILRLNNPEIFKIKLVGYLPRERPRKNLEELLETGIPNEEWNIEQPPWWVEIVPPRESPEDVIQKILGSSSSKLIGVQSKVETLSPPIFKHIPMVDFNCEVSQENLTKVKEALSFIGQKEGFLLDSGNSFHYYGSHLLNEKEWQVFMGNCLLTGLVELRYVGHSLIQGAATLRISTNPVKPKEPEVIATL